ncbi:MAG: hypothetical protein KGN39_09840 [Betaproteobacteria bacterium]|nr:hypothetical protein [Betaproteobacteria bacterium]
MSLAIANRLARSVRSLRLSRVPPGISRLLARFADHPGFALLVAAVALVCTLTFSFPFTAVLVLAVWLAPRRWLWIVGLSALGSGVGAALLAEVFHHLGWQQVAARWPELVVGEAVSTLAAWVARWGHLTLGLVAASPLPQAPAILLCAVRDPAPLTVFVAIAAGKGVKYLVVAFVARRLPALLEQSGEAGRA